MDSREAREHLQMVDRILTQAQKRSFRPWPALLISLGLAAALLDAGQQWLQDGRGPWLVIAGAVLMLGGYVYGAVGIITVRRRAARMSRASAEKSRFIGAVWLCIFIASFAQPHLFAGWGGAAIWSVGAAIQMMTFAFTGDRRAMVSAIVLLASIVAANYVAGISPGYVLAAGFVLGYVLPGVLYLTDRDTGGDGDDRG